VRGAIGGLWDAYFGDLMVVILGVSAAACLIVAITSSLLVAYSPAAGLGRVLAVARRPAGPRARVVRGSLALGLCVLLILDTTLVLRIAEVLAIALLIYVGMGELLTGLAPVLPRLARRPSSRRRAIALGGGAAVAAAVATTVVVLSWGTPKVRASTVLTCNGYVQLCDRRLDQVVFAGTHNSMSAADSPGWYIANQGRDIGLQLQDGIRLFKISTHYGVQDAAGHVRTDLRAEGSRLNRVSDKLSPQAREALARLGQAIGFGSLQGKHDIWLCHTLCELGATRMVDFLGTIRHFLDLNPGQVIVLFDEDYVAEKDLQSVFRRAGLFNNLETLHPGRALPTLGELIRSGHNVLVFAQNPPNPKYRWDMNAFQWIQDTPLGAVKPRQFTCRLSRGAAANPLLMMNNWADVFPPRLSPNLPLVKRRFILARANQCRSQRGRIPNLIFTDFYDRGDVVGAVRELNGLGDRAAAATVGVGGG
jgi:hypothetical protein